MDENSSGKNALLIVFASCLLALVLGSVHAFSVFLQPLEAEYSVTRSEASLTYSLALVSLTAAVLFGHHLFSRMHAVWLVVLICVTAACGALLAAIAQSLMLVWLGYGVLFGAANGLGYAFGLQISAQASPGREGFAMGCVTAAYALGAAISPAMFARALDTGGIILAMSGFAAIMFAIMPVCATLMAIAGAKFQSAASHDASSTEQSASVGALALWWIGYGAGVSAGLMAIGHATGISASSGVTNSLWVAPVVIAVFNLCGSLAGGVVVDRAGPAFPLRTLPLLSAVALCALAFAESYIFILLCLGVVGLAYGATIAAYPASIAKFYGTIEGTRIYGRVFTAWGTAGLLAPWLAGYLFDETGGYRAALLAAATIGIGSTAAAIVLFRFTNAS